MVPLKLAYIMGKENYYSIMISNMKAKNGQYHGHSWSTKSLSFETKYK